jgi:hypothetical protein
MDGQIKYGGWGFGSDASNWGFEECHSFFPGWDLSPPGFLKQGGSFYCNKWLNVLKVKPAHVLLSDWNGWLEGTSMGDSYTWTDTYGVSCPSWYRQLTKGYIAAYHNELIDGYYYRGEGQSGAFCWSNKQLSFSSAYPHGIPVIILPKGQLAAMVYTSGVTSKTVTELQNLSNGTGVVCTGIVTAVLGGAFYIEDPDRTAGIRVMASGSSPTVGKKVQVIGCLASVGTERYINSADAFELSDTVTPIQPLFVINKSIGGGPNNGLAGAKNGYGLSNISLLVKTTGRVIEKDTSSSQWFIIDDGSGVVVKVIGNASLPLNSLVVVKGVVWLDASGNTTSFRPTQA